MDERRAMHRHRATAVLALLLQCASVGLWADTYRLPLLPSSADPLREVVIRIVNHSADTGEVAITAIDDAGYIYGPITLTMEGQQAIEFSATDLEQGNATKGLSGGVGAGQGDWRLVLETALDIEPSAYVQTMSGFVDRIHDLLPPKWFGHRVTLVGPDSGGQHDGQLRLINPADTEAQVWIFGVEDDGNTVPGYVALSIPAGTVRTVAASELEDGADDLTGQLGERDGDWQLLVFANPSLEVMTLLDSVSGPLANLSVALTDPSDIVFFPAGGHASRSGMLRITNRSGPGDIEIHAVDDAGTAFGPITLTLAGDGTTQLGSADLEDGNPDKGLPTGLGSGEGDWRLSLESDLELDVVAYARTQDGFVTAIDDVAVLGDRRHHVPWFNPASETMQTSRLRLINPTDSATEIVIQAWDDAGDAAPEGAVSLTLAAGASKTLTANELEAGAEGLTGSLGDGEGKWRLSVQADQAIRVMSLVESSDGHLTNVSTPSTLPRFLNSCIAGPSDADGDGVSDHCDRDPATALRPLGGCSDGTYIEDADGNPGLVGDCQTLIAFANLQVQNDDLPDDHVLRLWGNDEQALMGTWEGITIADGHVTEIRMAGTSEEPGGLSGFIPPELGQLSELTILNLAHNELTGPIPPSLGELTKLTQLLLDGNELSGAIPAELGQLTDLTILYLFDNELSGSIPAQLGNLAKLRELRLQGNRLSDRIPTELGQLSDLWVLQLAGNNLTGSIPGELGQLGNLAHLQLYDNALSGRIPTELGRLVNLTHLYLFDNALSGPIPAQLGNLASLQGFNLNNNRLTGAIPPELGQLTNLTELLLSANRLSGPIPSELGNLVALRNLGLYANRLTGVIPVELGQLANLVSLNLYSNRLSGEIPAALGQLVSMTWLDLHDNELSGAIPAELGNLASLQGFNLYTNQLTGAIPVEFGQLTKLTEMKLSSNGLTGPIPPELGNLVALRNLSLHTNRLTGTIPQQLGQLVNLVSLNLYGNQLSGEIPATLGQLVNMTWLDLHGNELSGAIPAELGNLANLVSLRVNANRLTGRLPWGFWERVTRRELRIYVEANLITGFEPPPQRTTRFAFSADAAENGNASHHSVAYYQGPLAWSWNWEDDAVQHQQPILGRWAALAVRIDHEVAEPPLVITRVLDSEDEVLNERLTEAAPPSTVSTGSGQWRTEYVFELPGSLYEAGNKIVHVIDPDGEMAETDEDDNVGETITLYGEEPPVFRVTFIPIHLAGQEQPSVDATALMAAVGAFWPIADDFEARIGSPLETDPVDALELWHEMVALWNAEAEPDEFYHGVYHGVRPASGNRKTIGGGLGQRPGYVGYSQIGLHDVIPHEFGHNFSLGHAPGCGEALTLDENYPHADGGLGPHRGWDLNWRRFVSTEDGYADIMSSCSELDFPSDYHYRKASEYWLGTSSTAGDVVAYAGGVSGSSRISAGGPSWSAGQAGLSLGAAGGLALSGRVDASGVWSLTHCLHTAKGPRPPALDGEFTLILYGENGVELYREPLAVMAVSHSGEAGWAARTPVRPAREVVILNAQGEAVLHEELAARTLSR